MLYFAFSGLIECGHCDSSIVGEIKKQRYVYYHCTGSSVRLPERNRFASRKADGQRRATGNLLLLVDADVIHFQLTHERLA